MDQVIHLSRVFAVDAHNAFEMFTVNAKLQTWLTEIADVEPQVGGRYELFWQPDDRENNSTIGCRVTALEQDQFLSFEWRSPKQFKHFANYADPLTHVVVIFIPVQGGSQIHLLHSGWRSSPEWIEAMQWQERAWRVAFDALEKITG